MNKVFSVFKLLKLKKLYIISVLLILFVGVNNKGFGQTMVTSVTSLTRFSYSFGSGPSSEQSFTVSGTGLSRDITVTPPANFEISTSSGSGFQSTAISLARNKGTVSNTAIYTRLKAGLAGSFYSSEIINITSNNAAPKTITCSGTVYSVEIWKGTLQAVYPNLKGAFDAVNAGTYTGELEVRVAGNTVETASAILYQSGYTSVNGTSSYSSVKIYPTIDGITVTGNLTAPLIDLNGAGNVTIDGSVNALGSTKSLVIANTIASNTAGTSTIRFINSAESNTVRYCII